MSEEKICINCRWWGLNYRGEHGECRRISTHDMLDEGVVFPSIQRGVNTKAVLVVPALFGCTLFEPDP